MLSKNMPWFGVGFGWGWGGFGCWEFWRIYKRNKHSYIYKEETCFVIKDFYLLRLFNIFIIINEKQYRAESLLLYIQSYNKKWCFL